MYATIYAQYELVKVNALQSKTVNGRHLLRRHAAALGIRMEHKERALPKRCRHCWNESIDSAAAPTACLSRQKERRLWIECYNKYTLQNGMSLHSPKYVISHTAVGSARRPKATVNRHTILSYNRDCTYCAASCPYLRVVVGT